MDLDFTFEKPPIQGDVILKKLKALPKGAKLIKEKAKVLQQSEITGHHHHFRDDAEVDLYQIPLKETAGASTITPNMGKVIVVRESTQLYHGKGFEPVPHKTGQGDHDSLTVEPGVYYVDITREYDYDRMEESQVVD